MAIIQSHNSVLAVSATQGGTFVTFVATDYSYDLPSERETFDVPPTTPSGDNGVRLGRRTRSGTFTIPWDPGNAAWAIFRDAHISGDPVWLRVTRTPDGGGPASVDTSAFVVSNFDESSAGQYVQASVSLAGYVA